MTKRNQTRQRGMVLIAAMWAVLVLATMAFALSALVRSGGEELHARKEQLQCYYVARGAAYRAISMLKQPMVPHGEPRPFVSGQSRLEWDEAGEHVIVDVIDESGKIDLNAGSAVLLEHLFLNLGMDFNSAHALVAAIQDWRDPDDETRLGGAESLYYLSLPQPYRPANQEFRSVDELLLVRGVTPSLFYGGYTVAENGSVQRRLGLVDCLTVHGNGTVNMNYAPLPVLLSVPGMTPSLANLIVESRQRAPIASISDFVHDNPILLSGDTRSLLTGGSSGPYTLIASAVSPDGVTARVRAVAQTHVEFRTPQGEVRPGPPFLIREWDDSYVR